MTDTTPASEPAAEPDRPTTALSTVAPPGGVLAHATITREHYAALKDQICKGATDTELEVFAMTCNRTGLDPFARQIFAIKRYDSREKRDVMGVQVSIDGFRLVAQRSRAYGGQLPAQWCGRDGVWTDVWLDPEQAPYAARVGVIRIGFAQPIYAVALWREFVQLNREGAPSSMWAKFPTTMLAKCAEAQALRKAFPAELSGLYTSDEMEQAPMTNGSSEMAEAHARFSAEKAKLTVAQLDRLRSWVLDKGYGNVTKNWTLDQVTSATEFAAELAMKAEEEGAPEAASPPPPTTTVVIETSAVEVPVHVSPASTVEQRRTIVAGLAKKGHVADVESIIGGILGLDAPRPIDDLSLDDADRVISAIADLPHAETDPVAAAEARAAEAKARRSTGATS